MSLGKAGLASQGRTLGPSPISSPVDIQYGLSCNHFGESHPTTSLWKCGYCNLNPCWSRCRVHETFVDTVGALTSKTNQDDHELTYVGRIFAALPVDIRVSKLLLLGRHCRVGLTKQDTCLTVSMRWSLLLPIFHCVESLFDLSRTRFMSEIFVK